MWVIIAVFLALSLIAGVVVFAMRRAQVQPTEIVLVASNRPLAAGNVYISGAVVRPGIYPTRAGDTVTALVSAAGVSENADASLINIYVPDKSETKQPQKVDLNRAEAWLLQALPGIGEGKARLIVEFREKNGSFHSVEDLLKIEGFGNSLLEKIKGFATVGD
jgi:competence protein ComEA